MQINSFDSIDLALCSLEYAIICCMFSKLVCVPQTNKEYLCATDRTIMHSQLELLNSGLECSANDSQLHQITSSNVRENDGFCLLHISACTKVVPQMGNRTSGDGCVLNTRCRLLNHTYTFKSITKTQTSSEG